MKVSVEIVHNPDVSRSAFVRLSARSGRAGELRTANATLAIGDGLEELEELVCTFLAIALSREAPRPPDALWEE